MGSPQVRMLNEMGVEKNLRFLANKSLYLTNRKLYTGFRSTLKAMTLNDLEHQNRGFYGFFGDFELRNPFQE